MMRDYAIDALKGILILVIVYAHNNASPDWVLVICHPMLIGAFMMISGYLTKNNFDLIRRLKGLIYPFCLFLIIGIIWSLGYSYLIHQHIDIKDWAMDLVLGRNLRFNIPLWFLISLAEINVMKKGLDILRLTQRFKGLIVCLLYLLGIYLLSQGVNYFYLSQSFIYLLFFCVGRCLGKHRYLLNHETSSITAILLVSIVLLVRVNFLSDVLANGGLFVRYITDSIIGVIIAYWIYAMFSHFKGKKLFCFFGTNSLVVMSIHIFILDFIWRIWWTFFGAPGLIGGLIQTLIIILLLIPCCVGYKKFIEPHISPKKKTFTK